MGASGITSAEGKPAPQLPPSVGASAHRVVTLQKFFLFELGSFQAKSGRDLARARRSKQPVSKEDHTRRFLKAYITDLVSRLKATLSASLDDADKTYLNQQFRTGLAWDLAKNVSLPTERPPTTAMVADVLHKLSLSNKVCELNVSAAATETARPGVATKPNHQQFEAFLVLDFEATCEKNRRLRVQEIIELPTVLVCARTLRPVAEFQQYIRPTHAPVLSAFCTELTGITQAQVDAGVPFVQAFADYQKWLHSALQAHLGPGNHTDRVTFVTCGDWDLKTMLPAQLRHVGRGGGAVPRQFRSWCNIKKEYARIYQRKPRGMAGILRGLQMKLEGRHHSGIDDCRNIARILIRMMRDGAIIRETTTKQL